MPTNRYYQGPPSDHFDGLRFFNPGQPATDRSLAELLRWRLGERHSPWPPAPPTRQTVPPASVNTLRVTMIGHASVLIQAAGRNILVDPVWSQRASPLSWAGPRRANAPGVALENLPPIHAILLTHNHYDHMDIATLKTLWESHHPRIIAPLGNDAVIARAAPHVGVATADWHATVDLAPGTTVHLHPAHHWSARGRNDRRMALWCGFILATPAATIYVAGDTGYGDGQIFRDLKTRYPAIDLAILPIGAYDPRWFMRGQHINPEEAVQIMLDCGARHAIGVHWGTFCLTDEPRLEPPQRLAAELARRGLPAASFRAAQPGDVWTPAE